MQIMFVKLRTGDELVSEFSQDSLMSTLTNPVRLGMDPETGSIRFVPYPIVSNMPTSIKIFNNDIVFTTPVNEGCDTSYRKSFGHIVEPSKTLLTI